MSVYLGHYCETNTRLVLTQNSNNIDINTSKQNTNFLSLSNAKHQQIKNSEYLQSNSDLFASSSLRSSSSSSPLTSLVLLLFAGI